MSKEKLGRVVAYIPAEKAGDKASYRTIGTAFKDETGRISFCIDRLPGIGSRWQGWCNFVPATKPAKAALDFGDDIPF